MSALDDLRRKSGVQGGGAANAKQALIAQWDSQRQASAQPQSVATSVNSPKMPTLSEKLNFQSRMPQLGGTPAKEAVPMTPLMAKLSGANTKPLPDTPTALERLGLTAKGAAQQSTPSKAPTDPLILAQTRERGRSIMDGTAFSKASATEIKPKSSIESLLATLGKNAVTTRKTGDISMVDPQSYINAKMLQGGIGAVEGLVDSALNFAIPALAPQANILKSVLPEDNIARRVAEAPARLAQGIDLTGAFAQGVEEKTSPVLDAEYANPAISRIQRGVGNLGSAATQMLATMGVGSAVSGVSSLSPTAARYLALGSAASGLGAQEAANEGANIDEATAYGALSGALEAGVEMISGGIPGLGKGVAGKLMARIANMPNGAKVFMDIIGEGGEEVITTGLNPLIKRLIYNPDTPEANIDEYLEAFISGAALSGLLQGANAIGSKQPITQDIAGAQDTTAQDIAPQATQAPAIAQNSLEVKLPAEAQNAVESVVEPAAAIRQKIGELQQKLEYEKAVNANYYSEYRMAEPDSLTSDFYAQARQQAQNVADAQAELDAAKQELADIESQLSQEAEAAATADARRASEAELVKIAKEHDGRFVNESAISEMEKTGAAPELVADVRKRFDAASKITRRLNKLYADLGKANGLQESIEISRKIEKAKADLQGATQKLTDAQSAIANYNSAEIATQPEAAPATQPAIFPENSLGAKITQKLPEGTGAASPEFAYQERVNQQHSTDTAFTEAERQMPGLRTEDSTHQVVTDKNAMAQAEQRLAFDFEGEKADLATKQDWDKADTTTAHLILRKLTGDARKSGDYSEVIKWNKTLEKQKSAQGQALQANRQFANKPESIVADAAESLFSDKTKNISDKKKSEIMDKVSEAAETLDSISDGDTASVIAMIKDLSKQRKTDGIFNKKMSGAMNGALDYFAKQEGGFDFLKEIAAGQVRSVATDYNKTSFWRGVKSIRFANMLSSVATVTRNLVGNTLFDLGDSVSNNVAIPFDMALSLVSGNRSVALDGSWFSEAKRNGSVDGFLKSVVQVGLDVDIGNVQSKYETTPGRTFKMTGNPAERFLSTVQKWQGYALQSTDEFAKGGTKAEAQRGIDKLKRRGKTSQDALQDRATEVAKQRTFQNAGATAKAVLGIRGAMNTFSLKDSQGGSFGAGDLMVPFAQVPANLGAQAAKATPVGLATSLGRLADAVVKAKQGKLTPDQQADVVTDLGRGLTGTAGFAFFAGLAMKGVLSVVGSDDKDKDALEGAQGQSGTQLNLDALVRWMKGGDTEWQSGDNLLNMGFAEHLNVQMAVGTLVAEAYKEDESVSLGDVAKASVQGVFQSALELPAIAQIGELIDGYRYSKAEDVSGKLADSGGSYLGSQASSFIAPNLVAAVARGRDTKVRDTYSSDGVLGQARDSLFSKIPGLRETLPVKLDPWGNERTTGDNSLLNFINATVLPGRVNQFQTSDLNKELFRLDAADVNVKFPSRKMTKTLSYDDTDYDLDQKAQEAFHNKSHQLAQQYMSAAISESEYKSLSDGEKAKLLSDMYGFAVDSAKREYFTSRGIEYKSDYNKAFEAQQAGMKPSTYYHYKNALKKERLEGGTPSQLQLSKAIDSLELTIKQKGTLWDIQNGQQSDKNPFTGKLATEYGVSANETIRMMENFNRIKDSVESYEKAEGGPGKSQVQAAYFMQWLRDAGYNPAEVDVISDVFRVWQMIPIEKPSKKAAAYAINNPLG